MLLVATATEKEMKAALGHAGIPAVEHGRPVEFELNGRKLLLAVTGVGLVNAALVAGQLLGRPGLTGVVNLGIAGSYDLDECPLGGTAYVWQESWPEYGLLSEEGSADPKAIGFPLGHVDGKPIWNRIQLNPVNDAQIMKLSLDSAWVRTASVSVNGVTGTAARAGWLKMACNAGIENMEGFALGYAAALKGMPFLEVRTISNMVGSRYAEDWDLKGAFKALGQAATKLFSG